MYSQYFDSEFSTDDYDHAIGLAYLKLGVLAGTVKISLSHATDSTFLLSKHCAGDPHFLKLIRNRRIRVPRWADGSGPYESFESQIQKQRFSAWTELMGEQGIELRLQLLRNVRTAMTSCDSVNERLEHARRLWDIIEEVDDGDKEKDRRQPLAARFSKIRNVCPRLPVNDEFDEVRNILAGSLPDNSNVLGLRSGLLNHVRQVPALQELRRQNLAQQMINAEWNSVMAGCYGIRRFQALYRHISNPRPLLPGSEMTATEVARWASGEPLPPNLCDVPWSVIADAVAQPPGKEAETVAREIATQEARRLRLTLAIGGFGSLSALGGAFSVLGASALVPVPAIALAMKLGFAQIAEEKEIRVRDITRQISGYIAHLGNQLTNKG